MSLVKRTRAQTYHIHTEDVRTCVHIRQYPRRLTVTVSASEEETHYVQSTSVALDSDFSQNSRARKGTRKKAQRAMSRRDTPFRSVPCRPVTHSCEAHSQCESRPERNVIKLKDRITLFVEFRKMRGSQKLSARNRVCTHIIHFYKNKYS